jgi:hypothetical protein
VTPWFYWFNKTMLKNTAWLPCAALQSEDLGCNAPATGEIQLLQEMMSARENYCPEGHDNNCVAQKLEPPGVNVTRSIGHFVPLLRLESSQWE